MLLFAHKLPSFWCQIPAIDEFSCLLTLVSTCGTVANHLIPLAELHSSVLSDILYQISTSIEFWSLTRMTVICTAILHQTLATNLSTRNISVLVKVLPGANFFDHKAWLWWLAKIFLLALQSLFRFYAPIRAITELLYGPLWTKTLNTSTMTTQRVTPSQVVSLVLIDHRALLWPITYLQWSTLAIIDCKFFKRVPPESHSLPLHCCWLNDLHGNLVLLAFLISIWSDLSFV